MHPCTGVPGLLPRMHQRCHAPAVDELQACQIDDDLVLAGRGRRDRRHDGAGACQVKLAAQRSGNLTVASAGSHIHAEHVGAFLRQQQGGVLTQQLAQQLHQNSTPHARACPVQARSRARLGSRWRPGVTGRPLRGWRARMPSACWSLLEGRRVKAGRAGRLEAQRGTARASYRTARPCPVTSSPGWRHVRGSAPSAWCRLRAAPVVPGGLKRAAGDRQAPGGQERGGRAGGAHASGSRVPSTAASATSVRRRLLLRA